jgi:hypothetical protein
MLEELRDRNPGLATVRDYLAVQYLAKGDLPAFVAETFALAEIRGDEGDIAEARELARMVPEGKAATLALFVDHTMADFVSGDRKTLVWPIYVASMADDREDVLRLMAILAQRKEVWGSAGLVRQIARHWQADRNIMAQINARRPQSMVEPRG